MSKKINYFALNYTPKEEAISKEIELLIENFEDSNLIEISSKDYKPKLSKNHLKLHFSFLPIFINLIKRKNKEANLSHIYTSLGDKIFLRILNKRPIILTAGASSNLGKIQKQSKHYKKLDKIIVGNKYEKDILVNLNIPESKIAIVKPGIDLSKFEYKKEKEFTILFATSPPDKKWFEKRGIFLLLDAAKELPEIKFLLLWRKKGYNLLKQEIEKRKLTNIEVINKIVKDPKEIYSKASCTIIPFTEQSTSNKIIPLSALESLASGKPILISTKVGIKEIVIDEKSGVVFIPKKDKLIKAITELRGSYELYQKNARKTAEKHFSKEKFIGEYKKLYNEIIGRYN